MEVERAAPRSGGARRPPLRGARHQSPREEEQANQAKSPSLWHLVTQPANVVMILVVSVLLLLLFLASSNGGAAGKGAPPPAFSVPRAAHRTKRNATGVSEDRLLGGLLSPEFHDRACRGRYAASAYRKPSPYPVSPYLVSKLRAYEEYHRRCGPLSKRYREATKRLQSNVSAGEHPQCKYLVWTPIHGLGNRMLSLASAFLYALLSKRVLLVQEPPESRGLFCEPFHGSSWRLPPDFPVEPSFWGGSQESYVHMLRDRVVSYDDAGAGGGSRALPALVYLHLENVNFHMENHTFCEEDHLLLAKFEWMFLKSESYFAAALFLVPMYEDELDMLFPAKDSVFHHLARYLFHPANPVWGIIKRYYQGYLANADEMIGVQIRIVPQLPVPFEIMYEQVLRCSRDEKILPEVVPYAPDDVAVLAGGAAKVTAVLVVSLKSGYYEKLHAMYYGNWTAGGAIVTVHQPSHDEDQHTEQQSHNQKAVAEMFLLSYCDKIVITGYSTFGYVAHGLAGVKPWVLSKLDFGKMFADVPCVRAGSPEPCLHSPPQLDKCVRNEMADPAAFVPFLRRCEDLETGIKLFAE